MGKTPAPTHRLDDRATEKVINHPGVKRVIPSIAVSAKKNTKVERKGCGGCPGSRKRRGTGKKTVDFNAVRQTIAELSQQDKARLLKILNTKELVVPYVQGKKRVKLKIR